MRTVQVAASGPESQALVDTSATSRADPEPAMRGQCVEVSDAADARAIDRISGSGAPGGRRASSADRPR